MKTLAFATAIAAAAMISTGAHAVSSSISDIQMYVGNIDIEFPCPSSPATSLSISGTAPSAIDLSGTICLDPSGTGGGGLPIVRLTFALTNGVYVASSGTTFSGGTVHIETDWDDGNGYVDLATLDASNDPVPCLVQEIGHLGTSSTTPLVVNNTTFGLHVKTGTWPLPGLWHPTNGIATPAINTEDDDGINDGICALDLTGTFGVSAGLYVKGTVTAP